MAEEVIKPDLSPGAFNMFEEDTPEIELPNLPKKEEEKKEEEPIVEPKVAQVEDPKPDPAPKAEEAKATEEDTTEVSIKDVLKQATGYELDEDISDDTEGLVAGTRIIAEKMAQEMIEDFLESDQTIKEFVNHIRKGGDPAKFVKAIAPEVNYSEIDLSSEDSQKSVVRDYLKTQGIDKAEIEEYIKTFEDSNTLEKQAKLSKTFLSNEQKKAKESLEKEVEQSNQQRIKEQEAMWKQIETTLEKDTLSGINIAKKEKDEFKKFIGGTTKEGKSLRAEKYNNLSMEDKLLIDYLIYKGPDKIKTLVDNMATTKNTNDIKQVLNKLKKDNSSSGPIKNPDGKKPDLSPAAFKI